MRERLHGERLAALEANQKHMKEQLDIVCQRTKFLENWKFKVIGASMFGGLIFSIIPAGVFIFMKVFHG